MPGLGISFVPGQEQMGGQPGQPGQVAPSAALQRAIQLLSLRLPRFGFGGGQLAPTQILGGSPGGSPGGGGIDEILAELLRRGQAPPAGGSFPPPTIIPGGPQGPMYEPPPPPMPNPGMGMPRPSPGGSGAPPPQAPRPPRMQGY